MTVETGNTLSSLDQTWPLGTDSIVEGDNHIRLIKAILKTQFPGAGGKGFAKPITSTEDEINGIGAKNTEIDDAISDINKAIQDMATTVGEKFFPVGHLLITTKKADPASYGYPGSWQRVTEEGSLRVVDDNAGGFSGSDEIAVPLLEHDHDISHTHYMARVARTGSRLSGNPNGCLATYGTVGSDREYELCASGSPNIGKTSVSSNERSSKAGSSDTTINVSGKTYGLYMYKRIS